MPAANSNGKNRDLELLTHPPGIEPTDMVTALRVCGHHRQGPPGLGTRSTHRRNLLRLRARQRYKALRTLECHSKPWVGPSSVASDSGQEEVSEDTMPQEHTLLQAVYDVIQDLTQHMEEVTAPAQALPDPAATQLDVDKHREEDDGMNLKPRADMEKGLQGVQTALKIFSDHYMPDSEDEQDDAHSMQVRQVIDLLKKKEEPAAKDIERCIQDDRSVVAKGIRFEPDTQKEALLEWKATRILELLEVAESDLSNALAAIIATERTAACHRKQKVRCDPVQVEEGDKETGAWIAMTQNHTIIADRVHEAVDIWEDLRVLKKNSNNTMVTFTDVVTEQRQN